MSESSYVFMLRDNAATLEIQYNQQSGGVYLAEAQIFIQAEHINGGCYFEIDNVEDMDKFIAYLSEIRDKMYKHYDANQDNSNSVKPATSLIEAIANGPYCTECGNPQTKEEIGARISICFDCEKKQILDKVNKPVVPIPKSWQPDYVEQLKSTLTPEQKELIDGKPNPVVDLSDTDKLKCVVMGCKNIRHPQSGKYCKKHMLTI